jgi:hypothetical protein
MDKNEYIDIGFKRGLTPRCPILDLCQRRAWTIYFFSYYQQGSDVWGSWEQLLKHGGDLSDDFLKIK